MPLQAPLIDKRTPADIAKQVKDLLAVYAPEWKEFDSAGKRDEMGTALINIFARYCDIIIQRLNKVPEKNFLAFLDMLGASLQPPQPARVPLTFSLAAGTTVPAVVPSGTQAAAPPSEGEKDPILFETERALTLTPAKLAAVFTREPAQDKYADLSAVIDSPVTGGIEVFKGDRSIDHIFYLGHSALLGYSNLTSFMLNLTLDSDLQNAGQLKWEFWDGSEWHETQPGTIAYDPVEQKQTVEFPDLSSVPSGSVSGSENRWLRCRLATPITSTAALPLITDISMGCTLEASALKVENAFANSLRVDPTAMYYPFGEKPKLGDTFYLAHGEAFSRAGADVDITVTLIDQAVNGSASLRWEFWNGAEWKELTVTESEDGAKDFKTSGQIEFTLPTDENPQPLAVYGVEGYWIRARIISGNYGEDAKYADDGNGGYKLQLSTLAPPIIDKIEIGYTVSIESEPEKVLAYNDFTYEDASSGVSFRPFRACEDEAPTIYYGYTLPSGATSFPNRTISLYNRLADVKYGESSSGTGGDASALKVAWEYWSGEAWKGLTVVDDTENFTRTGIDEFLPPSDFKGSSEFGRDAYWIRASWRNGDFPYPPRLQRALLNTTMATQTVTIKSETLGSSDQSESQKFRTTRKPVLAGQQLEVRESEIPPEEERATIESEEGSDAITAVSGTAGRPKEIWVRWHEVADFQASGPRDRHYVMDHESGDIAFGNGQSGMIPPRANGNVRMTRYQTGGGTAGNRAAGSIIQLKTTVPYVEKVINTEPGTGGADAETADSLYQRAPATIRHRNRSVTIEDYEDLAMLASPGVARALCVPLRNLASDPYAETLMPGDISVVIVPRVQDSKPVPDMELINRVQEYLSANGTPTANLFVVGPLYLRVDVVVEIALVSAQGASAVELAVRNKLAAFLHPLTGGLNGKGWDFGREPYKSDLYALIEGVEGVDHINYLNLDDSGADPEGTVKKTGRFLVYSGNHDISMVFE